MQILWRDPRLNTSPRHTAQNCIVCTQRIKPAQQRKNHFSPSCHHLKTKPTGVTLGKEHCPDRSRSCGLQVTRAAVQIWESSRACNTSHPSQSSQKKPLTHTFNQGIGSYSPWALRKGYLAQVLYYKWSLSISQGEQLHSWRSRDFRVSARRDFHQQGVHTSHTEHMGNAHWFKTMVEHIIYPRSELLNQTFCWKQTHFKKELN